MIGSIDTFITGLFSREEDKADDLAGHDLAIAKAALLVHCAKQDGHVSEDEQAKLRDILETGLELTSDEADSVIATAEKREAVALDLHQFTKKIHAACSREERQRMVKWLWQIANADGLIDGDETNMVALVARLLDVETRDTANLRREAKETD